MLRFLQSLGRGLGLEPGIIGTTSLPNLSLELGLFKAQNFYAEEFFSSTHLKEKCNKNLNVLILILINALNYDNWALKGP